MIEISVVSEIQILIFIYIQLFPLKIFSKYQSLFYEILDDLTVNDLAYFSFSEEFTIFSDFKEIKLNGIILI